MIYVYVPHNTIIGAQQQIISILGLPLDSSLMVNSNGNNQIIGVLIFLRNDL